MGSAVVKTWRGGQIVGQISGKNRASYVNVYSDAVQSCLGNSHVCGAVCTNSYGRDQAQLLMIYHSPASQ